MNTSASDGSRTPPERHRTASIASSAPPISVNRAASAATRARRAGNAISSRWWWGTSSGYWNAFDLASTGTYTLEIYPEDDGTGSVDVTAYEAPDITGQTITPSTGGSSKSGVDKAEKALKNRLK